MSSGNPFRASQAFPPSTSTPVPHTSFANTDSSVWRGDSDHVLEDAASPPPKTKKSVRIYSPTETIPPHPRFDYVDDTQGGAVEAFEQDHPPSPPPPVAPTGHANHSVTAGEANAQMLGKDVMAAPDMLPSPNSHPHFDRPHAALSPAAAPANPFSRTLASLEPQEEGSGEERTSPERPTLGNNGASLDVESFKNLLLTGKPTPRHSGHPPHPAAASHTTSGAQIESSSSTDTSSTSRQSIFEHPQETYAESPRTSVDMAHSDEDESMGLVSEVKKGKKKPPPAPKPRQGGKPVTRQPQVVSFDSFEAAEPAPPTPVRRTDSSDVNKPLPPTPSAQQQPHISTQDTTPTQSPALPPRRTEPSTQSETPTAQKKIPPPVPLARRQSQLKTTTTSNRSRSNSNLTISSQHSIDAVTSPAPSNNDPMSSAKSPPPPPPSRYGAKLTKIDDTDAGSSSTSVPQRSSSGRTPRSVPDPPSSRRSTLESDFSSPTQGINRTSSVSSNRRNVSGESTGSSMPPPPPPPRRRQSNRSSLDQPRPNIASSSSPTESRRTSTEYRRTSLDSKRRTSVASESSLRREYAPVDERAANEYALQSPMEESENRLGVDNMAGAVKTDEATTDSSNILDDMEKFQREIDALRTRYQ